MKPILRYAGAILAVAVLLYAGAIALSFVVLPERPGPLDTESVYQGNVAYSTESRYLVFTRAHFAEKRDRVIMIGQSNVREVFRPALLEPRLSGWEVDDLGLSGANISEIRRAVDMVYDSLPPDWRGHTLFVLGMNYVTFGTDATDWQGQDSDLVNEMLRFGLYVRDADGTIRPALSAAQNRIAAILLRPVIVSSYLAGEAVKFVIPGDLKTKLKAMLNRNTDSAGERRMAFQEMTAKMSEAGLDAMTLDQDTRDFLVRERLIDAGGRDAAIVPEQFDALKALALDIAAHGDGLVLASLPLPRWHLDGMRLTDQSYRQQIAALVPVLAAESKTHFVDLSDHDEAEDFYDSVHPKPHIRKIWCDRLADYLIAQGLAGKRDASAPGAQPAN